MSSVTEFKSFTYQDYCKLDESIQYELIYGELIMIPAPSSEHQKALTRLGNILFNHVNQNNLGEIFYAPYDVILSDNLVVQPDILFISKGNENLIKERGFFGVPDLVVEIVSPSSLKRDLEVKRRIYESFGVKEYWIIFPSEKALEILSIQENIY